MVIILGRNTVLESLRSGQPITDLYLKEGIGIDSKVSEILSKAKEGKVRYRFVSKRFLDNMSQGAIHQGIIAVKTEAERISLQKFLESFNKSNKSKDLFIVYIREAQNEFNVGGIIRSAEAAGADVVILPPKTHLTPQMIRASMGASEHMTILNENIFNAIRLAQKELVKVVAIELTGNQYYFQADLKGPAMLIVGGEDKSLSKEITSKCDCIVKIPQLGHVNSLNMGVAFAIVAFEKLKQDKF